MNPKGQTGLPDLVLGIVAFILLLSFVLAFSNASTENVSLKSRQHKMETSAITISDLLVKTQGVPADWDRNNPSSVLVTGLASFPNVLSEDKVSEFTALDYDDVKSLLGVDGEFLFQIEDLNGTVLHQLGDSNATAEQTIVQRLALLEGEKVRVKIVVHE